MTIDDPEKHSQDWFPHDGVRTIQDASDRWGDNPADRWVMVRAAICGLGLWHSDGGSDTFESLPPIPVSLARQLEAWADWHDGLDAANTTYPEPQYWEQRADAPLEAFNAEGRAIARALKAALPGDWTVVYENVDAWLRRDEPLDTLQTTFGPGPLPR